METEGEDVMKRTKEQTHTEDLSPQAPYVTEREHGPQWKRRQTPSQRWTRDAAERIQQNPKGDGPGPL